MKIAINKCYGGFVLSDEAVSEITKKMGIDEADFNIDAITRHHPMLIEVIENLGDKACGNHSKIRIVEIPDGVDYIIEDYDGVEHVAERHRAWG